MNFNQKVSILITVYYNSEFLSQCLNSVINQTYRNLQICLVNDGSTDNSLDIISNYADKDSRIEYISKENSGVADTRNHLLNMAKGDYVLFVDSDDWIEPDMVEYLINTMVKYNADIVCCETVKEKENKPDLREIEFGLEDILKKFLLHKEMNGSLCNKLIKINLLHNERFHCGISYGEDALFCWGVFQKVNKVVMSNKQLYNYRMNDDSISHQTFGPKKLSGHTTWDLICSEADKKYPEISSCGKARWGMESTLLLNSAVKSDYPKDNSIKMLQKTVKKNYKFMRYHKITSIKGLIFAFVISRVYGSWAKYF